MNEPSAHIFLTWYTQLISINQIRIFVSVELSNVTSAKMWTVQIPGRFWDQTHHLLMLFSKVWSAGMVVLELANGKCPKKFPGEKVGILHVYIYIYNMRIYMYLDVSRNIINHLQHWWKCKDCPPMT